MFYYKIYIVYRDFITKLIVGILSLQLYQFSQLVEFLLVRCSNASLRLNFMFRCVTVSELRLFNSGHRWLKSLRMYKRVNVNQQQAVSNILSSTERGLRWKDCRNLRSSLSILR